MNLPRVDVILCPAGRSRRVEEEFFIPWYSTGSKRALTMDRREEGQTMETEGKRVKCAVDPKDQYRGGPGTWQGKKSSSGGGRRQGSRSSARGSRWRTPGWHLRLPPRKSLLFPEGFFFYFLPSLQLLALLLIKPQAQNKLTQIYETRIS